MMMKVRMKMAYAASTNGLSTGVFGGIAKLYNAVVAELHNRRVYFATKNELSALSARDLDDLGISRSDINRIAYEAAYGA
jgi:uncharacterized protein YjiS (DUF1127 family)